MIPTEPGFFFATYKGNGMRMRVEVVRTGLGELAAMYQSLPGSGQFDMSAGIDDFVDWEPA